jgi:small-conductance mechanosensitive channel
MVTGNPALAQSNTTPGATAQELEEKKQRLEEGIDRLTEIRQSLIERQQKLSNLKKQLETAAQTESKQELQTQLDELNKSVENLSASFEQIVIGGIDLEVFSDRPAKDFDWQQELIQITQPILKSLNELTEKPRKIEQLRSQISLYEDQLKVIQQALESIAAFRKQPLPDILRKELDTVATQWEQRRADTENALEVASYQLASLQGEDVSALDAIREALGDFMRGRGLTLGLALASAVAVWVFIRFLFWLVQERSGKESRKNRITRNRLLLYSFRVFTGLVILLAVMTVFYIRGDLLLLALSIMGLAVLVLGLRQTLPRFISETRLLLDLGPVRTNERVVYNGLPLKVESINVYSLLRNPEIEGVVRLPLGALNELVSRPGVGEPWFPTRPGEYVMLPDGRFAQVLRQTVELVQLRVLGSLVQFPTKEFLQLDLRNLSREGFGLLVTFGIDHKHQPISLEQVSPRFREALVAAFESQGFTDDVEDFLVEFKEVGVNSLDYLIYLSVKGRAAGSYFKLVRLVQQTCIEVCNQQCWGVPTFPADSPPDAAVKSPG